MEELVLAGGGVNHHFDRLTSLIGRERSLHEISQTLHFLANGLHPAAVGAVHVTCTDEAEMECAEALQQGFVRYLLPPLKTGRRAPVRLAMLGGQYDWGALRLAEQHFALPPGRHGFTLMLIKINTHVGVSRLPGAAPAEPLFGTLRRYGIDSPCCGALGAFLTGSTESFTVGLRELLGSEALDREAMLHDASKVHPARRALVAALVVSRLQARKAVLDIQDYVPTAPTYWLVVPCVTLNQAERDTEIVCGVYVVDGREGARVPAYRGLGDDPSAYRIQHDGHAFIVSDGEVNRLRRGRDHRALARTRLAHTPDLTIARDARLDRIRRDVSANRHHDHHHAKALLRAALPILAEIAPVPAALLLFAEGAVAIRHAFRVDRLARELEGTAEARAVLDDVHARIDQLDQDRAAALIELLVQEYSRAS